MQRSLDSIINIASPSMCCLEPSYLHSIRFVTEPDSMVNCFEEVLSTCVAARRLKTGTQRKHKTQAMHSNRTAKLHLHLSNLPQPTDRGSCGSRGWCSVKVSSISLQSILKIFQHLPLPPIRFLGLTRQSMHLQQLSFCMPGRTRFRQSGA